MLLSYLHKAEEVMLTQRTFGSNRVVRSFKESPRKPPRLRPYDGEQKAISGAVVAASSSSLAFSPEMSLPSKAARPSPHQRQRDQRVTTILRSRSSVRVEDFNHNVML